MIEFKVTTHFDEDGLVRALPEGRAQLIGRRSMGSSALYMASRPASNRGVQR